MHPMTVLAVLKETFVSETQYYSYSPTLDRQTRTSSQGLLPLSWSFFSFPVIPSCNTLCFQVGETFFPRQKRKLPVPACVAPNLKSPQSQTTCAPPPPAPPHDQHAHPTVTHRTHDSLRNSFLIIKCTTAASLHFYSL